MDNLSAHKPAGVRELIKSRGCELIYLTRLLAGLQPYRRSVRQDQGYAAPSRSPHEGCFGRRIGQSAFGDQCPGRPRRLLRACRLSSTSPTTVKRAEETDTRLAFLRRQARNACQSRTDGAEEEQGE